MIHKLTSLFESAQIYREILAGYKTKSAKKAFLTRTIKKMDEFIEDIREAVTRVDAQGRPSISRGWFLGEKYYSHHLAHYKREVAFLEKTKVELSGGLVSNSSVF